VTQKHKSAAKGAEYEIGYNRGTMTTTYAVKIKNGKAQIYDAKTGGLRRSVGSGVVSAQITGDLVQVTKENGRVELYDPKTGGLRRSL
jgi:hypothetical protein